MSARGDERERADEIIRPNTPKYRERYRTTAIIPGRVTCTSQYTVPRKNMTPVM